MLSVSNDFEAATLKVIPAFRRLSTRYPEKRLQNTKKIGIGIGVGIGIEIEKSTTAPISIPMPRQDAVRKEIFFPLKIFLC